MEQEKPILIFHKKSEKHYNKITIPKKFVEEHGNEFYMEIYKNKIVLIPIKEERS